MIFYMIRHKATGEFMPELKRTRGYSWWNPSKSDTREVLKDKIIGVPRLFPFRRNAHLAIVQWNALPNARTEYGQSDWQGEAEIGIRCKPDGRSKDDLEIVEVTIEVRE
jgi:hypothetical protein